VISFPNRDPEHDMMQNNTTTRPPVGLDGTIHRRRSILLPNFWSCPALRAAIFVDLRVFILNFDSYVEIDDFQVEIAVTDKVARLDVSMRNFVLVKIRESLDEAPAESDTTGDTATVYVLWDTGYNRVQLR
jgi:hypothetical protein